MEVNTLSLLDLGERLWIMGKLDTDTYGIFGPCASQSEATVENLTQNHLKDYRRDTLSHKKGQKSVDIVVASLQAIPGCSVEQTPNWSSADIKWKWDIILKYQNKLFPIQVKSSLEDIEECRSLFEDILEQSLEQIRRNRDDRLDALESRLSESRPKSSSHAAALNSIDRVRKNIKINSEEKEKDLKLRSPLYIWVSWDLDGVLNLLNIFCSLFNIDVNKEIKKSAISYYIERYKPEYLKNLEKCIQSLQKDLEGGQQNLEAVAMLVKKLESLVTLGQQWLSRRGRVVQEIIIIKSLMNALHEACQVLEEFKDQNQILEAELEKLEQIHEQALITILEGGLDYAHRNCSSMTQNLRNPVLIDTFWKQDSVNKVYTSLCKFSKRLTEIKLDDNLEELSAEVGKLLNSRHSFFKGGERQCLTD